MSKLPRKAKKELQRLSRDPSLKQDLERISQHKLLVFFKNGEVDVDAYIDFVTQFNEFISHQPKLFQKMEDRDMRL